MRLVFILLASISLFAGEEEILRLAQEENRPILALFFSRQDCPWSQKLSQEILSDSTFQEEIRQDALFWQVPFDANPSLCHKYKVHECPQFLLLDPEGKEFARFGVLPLDGKGHAAEVHRLIEDFQEVCLALDSGVFDERIWAELYTKAKQFSTPFYKEVLLQEGMEHEQGTYFLLQQYAELLGKYKLKHPKVLAHKRKILAKDKGNQLGSRYQIALLEFRQNAGRTKYKMRADKVILPLLEYAKKARQSDPDVWKAEWLIAQFLLKKGEREPALEHAEAAFLAAPEHIKAHLEERLDRF
ncbi:MAG: hypothetical protein JSS61_01290 [Verrucomicrobia bacterium]|nr:hypothetical protein [Verrucomicrobiota bacterium]